MSWLASAGPAAAPWSAAARVAASREPRPRLPRSPACGPPSETRQWTGPHAWTCHQARLLCKLVHALTSSNSLNAFCSARLAFQTACWLLRCPKRCEKCLIGQLLQPNQIPSSGSDQDTDSPPSHRDHWSAPLLEHRVGQARSLLEAYPRRHRRNCQQARTGFCRSIPAVR